MSDHNQPTPGESDRDDSPERPGSERSGAGPTASRRTFLCGAAAAGAVSLSGLAGAARSGDGRFGAVAVDGGEAYRRLSEAVAETVRRERGVGFSVRGSGTDDGFRRFAAGETDVHVADRPMSPGEREIAAGSGVAYERVDVALGGAALVHPESAWYDCLTRGRLAEAREGDGPVETYAEVVDAEGDLGSAARALDGAVAREGASVLVRGTREFQYESGRGGVSYYRPDSETVRPLSDARREEVEHTPLVRLAFLYANRESLRRGAVEQFRRTYRDRAARTTGDVTYFAAPPDPA